MAKVQIGDISLQFFDHGKGPAMILIGGLFVDHTIWSPVIDKLSQHFRVIAFDNRGIAEVTEEPYSTTTMAEDTIKLMDHLGIDKAYIVGHSMGGAIAQMIALLYPERVSALAICASFAKLGPKANLFATINQKLFDIKVPMKLMLRVNTALLFGSRAIDLGKAIDQFVQMGESLPTETLPHQIEACKTHDTMDRLKMIDVPTLVIVGEEDALAPVNNSREIHERIRNSRLVILPDIGHMLQIEDPELFVHELLQGHVENHKEDERRQKGA